MQQLRDTLAMLNGASVQAKKVAREEVFVARAAHKLTLEDDPRLLALPLKLGHTLLVRLRLVVLPQV